MAGLTGSRAAQVYASQGESTPAAKLPDKFKARNQRTDASPGIVTLIPPPPDHLAFAPGQPCAVVRRWPRMVGMRYLYALQERAMPVTADAAGAIANPFISKFQPILHGPIVNGGFNDALFQAGYPGFNLGLSFAVQTLDKNIDRPPEVSVPPVQAPNAASNARPKYKRPRGSRLGG